MKLCQIASAALGCLALSAGSAAWANNGIQFSETSASGEIYIECLGEYIAFEEHIDMAFHQFVTPSGTYHMVDKWTFALTATGMTTGREWAGVLQSPTQLNGGPGEVLQYAIRGVIRGITKGAPNFAWTGSFKSTVNANGELVVLRDTEGFAARCLGKKN